MNPQSHLAKYIQTGSAHYNYLSGNEVGKLPMSSSFVYNTYIHSKEKRFGLAQKLATCVMSAGEFEINRTEDEQVMKNALSLLFHYSLPTISSVLHTDFGYNYNGRSKKLVIDAEHALLAKCVLGESGRVFNKMKRACTSATEGYIQFPQNSKVVELEASKNIGCNPRIMLKGAGRFNTIAEILDRYLMSQTCLVKAGDFFFRNQDENNEVQLLTIFQNDDAEMCFERNSLAGVLMFVPNCKLGDNSVHNFQDPELLVDVAMMDCKEELTVVQYMFKEIFKSFDPNRRYDVICGLNDYDISEGYFPAKMKNPGNRVCVLCTKYGLMTSRVLRQNVDGNVWVHSNLKNVIFSGADTKNQKYQSNVKTGYCRICKCCMGRAGDEGGWCKGVYDGRLHALRTNAEDKDASDAWDNCFEKFEEDLYRGKVDIPDTMPYPRSDEEKYVSNNTSFPIFRGTISTLSCLNSCCTFSLWKHC